jgi:hypothetical protein
VKAGFAWWYWKYASRDRELEAPKSEARHAKRGLWVDRDPKLPFPPRSSGGGRPDEEHDMGEMIPGKINIVLQVYPVHIGAEEIIGEGQRRVCGIRDSEHLNYDENYEVREAAA